MSIKALSWAMQQAISCRQKCILLILADGADYYGRCRSIDPSFIAEKSRLSEENVIEILQGLYQQRLILTDKGNERVTYCKPNISLAKLAVAILVGGSGRPLSLSRLLMT